MIKDDLNTIIPVFHAVDVVVEYIKAREYHEVLLLASKFTMEDGFFAEKLEKNGIKVTIPNQKERDEIQDIHDELLQGVVTESAIKYFSDLIESHKNLDAVVLGCTEFPLVVKDAVALPIIDPVHLQATGAIDFSLDGCG